MSERYRWAGGEEAALTFQASGPVRLLVLQPLFEEANRTRHMIVSAMRRLAAAGIGTTLPDLPGMGESLTPLADVTFDAWRDAARAAATAFDATATLAFRGGALIDDAAALAHGWRLTPENGARIVRDLERASIETLSGTHVRAAGNVVRQDMIEALRAATPAPLGQARTVRLATEAADADAKLPGTPLWRRSEPGDDPRLEDAIVADIVAWVRTCAAS